MGKRKALIDSDSSSGSEDLESELLSLSKKKKTVTNNVAPVKQNNKNYSDSDSDWAGNNKNGASGRKKKVTKKVNKSSSSESSSDSDEDDDEDEEGNEEGTEEPPAKKPALVPTTENIEKPAIENKAAATDEEPEEGEVSDSENSSNESSSSSDSEFDDGFDENLMGDEEDRARLNALSEKERETEIFKRIERRDVMRCRWEIERKLKLAKRGEKAARDKPKKDKKNKKKKEKKKSSPKLLSPEPSPVKLPPPSIKEKSPSPVKQQVEQKSPIVAEKADTSIEEQTSPDKKDGSGSASEYFDPKERSKERKKNVEANRTDDKRSNAMAMLKAKREGKAKREEEEAKRQAEKEREEEREELDSVTSSSKAADKIKVSDIYSDDSGSSSSSEDEEEEKSGKGSGSKQSGESSQKSESSESEDEEKEEKSAVSIKTKEELNKLRLSRYKMEKFINLPIFEKTILNTFVRISIGSNNQRPVYRVAEIVGVVETAKIYQLGKLRTNRGLRLKHGSQERVFRLEFISNQDFTDSEFDKWRDMCEKTNVPLPTLEQVEKKQADIKFAMNYEYSDADVHKIIEERNRFRKNPTNYAMKKTMLMKERDAALLRGENEFAHELSEQIDKLESRASELDKRRSSSLSLISYINDRNRKKNVEEAEKAIREEIIANKGQRIEDPFTRRLTQPRMTFSKDTSNDKKEDKAPPLQQPQPPPPPGRRRNNDDAKKNSVEHNLYSLHDFEIDLDVPLPVNPVNVMPKPVAKPAEAAPKRSLNLEDYKKKRGLI